jgi:DNA modification methylase
MNPTIAQISAPARHPAKYSDSLMDILAYYLRGADKVLDPFAGTGKIKLIRPDAYMIEIEPEWATIRGATVGDATRLPFASGSFDAVCTSPTYGNRMADTFTDKKPEKHYVRNTYTHALGRKLNPKNSGGMQWGEKYRRLHLSAWLECSRVLKRGGHFILNISDHIRNGKIVPVSVWHVSVLTGIGFVVTDEAEAETPRNKMGQNASARVPVEHVYKFVNGNMIWY